MPAIAVSYGVVKRPVPQSLLDMAHDVTVDVCARLWENWGNERFKDGHKEPTQLFTVNVPLVEEPLLPQNRKMCWTNMWRNSYGGLFQQTKLYVCEILIGCSDDLADIDREQVEYDPADAPTQDNSTNTSSTAPAGPAALPSRPDTPKESPKAIAKPQPTRFRFAPKLSSLLDPNVDSLPVGCDGWGFAKGYITITPMRAEYYVPGDNAGISEGESGESRAPGTIWTP